jgi:hypothetical protein
MIETIINNRHSYPTYYINKTIQDFKTYQLNMTNETHDIHCPSRELGFIWLEKINLVLEASCLNPYQSEWFCWIDAGICIYREEEPPTSKFPNPQNIHKLSKTKINYCSSEQVDYTTLETIKKWDYIHNISGTFVLHISIIPNICELFYEYLEKCRKEANTFVCYSDQCIWTHMFVDKPYLFNKVGDGYGSIIQELS